MVSCNKSGGVDVEEVTEIDLILLDIAKIWDLLEDRTRSFLSDIIVGSGEFEEFSGVMEDINEEMKHVRSFSN